MNAFSAEELMQSSCGRWASLKAFAGRLWSDKGPKRRHEISPCYREEAEVLGSRARRVCFVHAGSLPRFVGTLKWNRAVVNVISYTCALPFPRVTAQNAARDVRVKATLSNRAEVNFNRHELTLFI